MISHDSFQAIADLDLEPIKVKLMHEESGEGWSLEQVNAVEFEYRRFLYLMKTFPQEQTAPLMDVDIFWHYHILDTMKYAADCEAVFGYFLHHFPYIGLRGEDDEQVHHRVGERMRELYEATFGESYDRSARPAYSGAAVQAGGAETAYSGAATKQASETAYSGAAVAYSGAATQQAKQTAYSGAAVAYSGAATQQAKQTAYSGAAVAYSGAATQQAKQTAYSGAAVAYSGAATQQAKETAYSGAQTVAYSGAAISDAHANKMAYSGLQADKQTAYSGAAIAPKADGMYTVRPRLGA
ncbi:glycine-rich domain-containing protein-like [Duganella sp. FT3S]|uniref:Glycine-rich domain-containing protein-like n=1 Tax=Rugamonas fusca TaxID=2758568 RepID=A0A7W2EG13_9BURK|nr:glycine-rich domain-containing protein-like [Rugamonas fusca]MBA5605281.1 glycine-rich domain-containing protein-like [Rugamonas fusca]